MTLTDFIEELLELEDRVGGFIPIRIRIEDKYLDPDRVSLWRDYKDEAKDYVVIE